MKAVFVHSTRMVQAPDGRIYSRGAFDYSILLWYLKHFDELTIVCRLSKSPETIDGMNLASGPNVTFVGLPDDHGNYLQQLQRSRNLPAIRDALLNADTLIVRSSGIGWLAAREADKLGIPWAVEVVGDAWDAHWNYGNLAGKLYAPIAWFEARKWIRSVPYAIYVTNNYLQKRYPCSGTAAGVSDVQINPVPDSVLQSRLLRPKTQLRNNSVRCGLIGSLSSRYKGLHVAMRSMSILRTQGIELHLHVLGAGNHQVWVNEAKAIGVSDLLHLDGTLPAGDAVFAWLDKLDFYIQPSLTEGLPRALIEAMSRAIPALASSAGGIPELLPAECLHKPGDHRKLASDMQRIIHEATWRAKMAERNFNEAKQYYTDVIEQRRDAFWSSFAEYARKHKRS